MLNEYKEKILKIILSILASFSLTINLNLNIKNLILIILSILYYNLLKKIKFKDKKKLISSIIFSIIVSLIYIFGNQLETGNEIYLNIKVIIEFLLLIESITIITYFIIDNIGRIFKAEKKVYHFTTLNIFIPLFFIGMLYYLILYPGVYGYDSGFQIAQFLENSINITTDFSLINSYCMYILVNVGKYLFNSYMIGFSIYTLIQMIFINLVIAKLLKFVYDEIKNRKIIILFIIFYMLFPFHHILSLSACQDVFYAGFLVLIGIELYKYIRIKSNNMTKIIVYSILLCLSRNNGIYVVILTLLIILIFYRTSKKKTLIMLGIIIISNFILSNSIIYIFSAYKSESLREMLSLPSQQIINVYTYNYNDLSAKDIKKIEKFYPGELKSFYNVRQLIADTTKGSIDVQYTKKNFMNYINLYIKLGIKYPKNYINAFLLNTLGLWYPEKKYYDSRMYHPFIEVDMLDAHVWNKDYIEIERMPIIDVNNKLENIINENKWQKIPILSSFFKGGIYFILLVFIVIYNIYNKNYINLLSVAILGVQYLILILSPVILFRYLYSIILFTPLLITTLFIRKKR